LFFVTKEKLVEKMVCVVFKEEKEFCCKKKTV